MLAQTRVIAVEVETSGAILCSTKKGLTGCASGLNVGCKTYCGVRMIPRFGGILKDEVGLN